MLSQLASFTGCNNLFYSKEHHPLQQQQRRTLARASPDEEVMDVMQNRELSSAANSTFFLRARLLSSQHRSCSLVHNKIILALRPPSPTSSVTGELHSKDHLNLKLNKCLLNSSSSDNDDDAHSVHRLLVTIPSQTSLLRAERPFQNLDYPVKRTHP